MPGSEVPIVVDGSKFDHTQPYLLVKVDDHIFGSDEAGGGTFDASSNKIITLMSVNRQCGAIIAPDKHKDAFTGLGYPVVRWGDAVAFPMTAEFVQKRHAKTLYSGALTLHSFSEPKGFVDHVDEKTKEIVGTGRFDGINHLAGAYIPLNMALKCATEGET